jgi:hypothetical protein
MSEKLQDLVDIPISAYSGNKRARRKMRVVDNAPFTLAQHFNPFLASFVLFQFTQNKDGRR